MAPRLIRRTTAAITVAEILFVCAGLAFIILLVLPLFTRAHTGCRINCVNNLKQIGLSFKTWSLDNNDRFPMQVPASEGGTMEWVSGPNAFTHFRAMSNELSTPMILVCPEDRQRRSATNFGVDLGNIQISYFVGLEVCQTNPASVLSGDRNLASDSPVRNGTLVLYPKSSVTWSPQLHNRKGNLLLIDGSVIQSDNRTVNSILRSGGPTNRLAMP